MAYCRKCGALIDDYAAVCPKCGTPQNGGPNNPPPAADNGGFLWGLLGCCIPIAGLILFLVWKDTKPRTAKAAGIGALVCVIAYVLMYVAAAVLGISAAGSWWASWRGWQPGGRSIPRREWRLCCWFR